MNIEGSVAIVTGGASGLGEACAEELVKGGAKVAVFDVSGEKGEEAVRRLGKEAIFVHADVASEEDVTKGIERAASSLGPVRIVVNCAGGGLPMKVLTKKGPMPLAAFNRTLQINLVGTFNVIRLAAARMVNNTPLESGERGVIVNTASIAAFEGQVGQADYSAAKGGIVGMTLPIARELADYGIRVMTVAPGLFDTPLLQVVPEPVRVALGKATPFPSRLGTPREFAGLVRHIIENPMLNGSVIRLDGALRLSVK